MAPCSALGAATVTRPLADLTIVYPAVPVVAVISGSCGIAVKYFSLDVKTDKSISPVHGAAWQTAVAVVVIVEGKVPLLSIEYWYTALRMVLTSARRWAFRVSPNCLVGLMAIITIPAKIAMAATTRRISRRVKPFLAGSW